MSETTSPDRNRIGTVIAILIAIVSTVAALGAWRVAVATTNAGDADTEGLLAAVDRENAFTEAYILLYGHLNAYAHAVRHDAVARALKTVEDTTTDTALKARLKQERDGLIYAANTQRYAIPQQYLDRDQKFDQERDVGETIADAALERDTFPEPHFARADAERAQGEWLHIFLVVLALAFVFLTLADAIKHPVRYGLVFLAVFVLAVAVIGGIVVDFVGLPF
jgi:hypothetical protein